jgi:two-component system OmpR family response regulator
LELALKCQSPINPSPVRSTARQRSDDDPGPRWSNHAEAHRFAVSLRPAPFRRFGKQAMKVLLIEDDSRTSAFIKGGLEEHGHVVDLAASGRDGLFLAAGEAYDVIVVDRMLPGLDGLGVVKTIRGAGVITPVLFLTTMGGIDDRVQGLEAGGDDYLVKPFAFAELLARVEALARRSATVVKDTVLRVGDLRMDLVSRTVTRSGRDIQLLPREFQVLEYLVCKQGQIVPRAMLLQHVWDLHFGPTTNIIDVYVGRVRRKVDDQQAYPLIHTVRGVGFCVRAPC